MSLKATNKSEKSSALSQEMQKDNNDHMMANPKSQKLINSLKAKEKIGILFVCLGNICRSPAAEGIMRDVVKSEGAESRFDLDSAGTGRYHIGELPDKRMRVHASRRGYDLVHRCRQVKEADFDRFDIILAMDASNEANLKRFAPTPEAEEKIIRMADFVDLGQGYYDYIPDPYYEGSEGFELVLDLLENGCRNLFEALRAE